MEREICNAPAYSRYNLQKQRVIYCSGKTNLAILEVNSELSSIIKPLFSTIEVKQRACQTVMDLPSEIVQPKPSYSESS